MSAVHITLSAVVTAPGRVQTIAMDDLELLREFGRTRSTQAFTTLVDRYLPMFYAAVLRQVRDPHVADDVTQAVLLLLMSKANVLPTGTLLPAWLFNVTRYVCLDVTKMEARRKKHEQAAARRRGEVEPPASWAQLSPIIDEAISKLKAEDRDAVVLRFLLNKSSEEIAYILNVTEDAARQRVSRALQKLRAIFAKRGFHTMEEALASVMAANAVHPAPVGITAIAHQMALPGSGAMSTPPSVLARSAAKSLRPRRWPWTFAAVVAAAVVALLLFGRRPAHLHESPKPIALSHAAPVTHRTFDYSVVPRTITRLMLAANRRDVASLRQFIAEGDDVNAVSTDGNHATALLYALSAPQDQSFEMVDAMLGAGANPNVVHAGGYSALMWAVRNRSPRATKLLIDHGADPTFVDHRKHQTAADWAVMTNNPTLIELVRSADAAWRLRQTKPEHP